MQVDDQVDNNADIQDALDNDLQDVDQFEEEQVADVQGEESQEYGAQVV